MINNTVKFRTKFLEVLNIRVVGSAELEYYWTIQIDDLGCVEVAATVFGSENPDQIITLDPQEALKVGQAMIACAEEEMKKQVL